MVNAALTAEERKRYEEGIAVANIPTLLMVLVQLTGNLHWLEDPYKPVRSRGNSDNDTGGLSEEIQQEIRDAGLDAILAWKEGRPIALPELSAEMLIHMLATAMGEPVSAEYGEFTAAQLGQTKLLDPTPVEVPDGFNVLVIGAGIAGLCAAVYLKKAGIPYIVIERQPTVGGVWLENRYPGAGVDSPNHLYSYSFAPGDWGLYFCLRDELYGYLEEVSREFDVRKNIRFETEVTRLTYDEASQSWSAEILAADGTEETLNAKVVLSGVGLFNPPLEPDIPGLEEWTARKWHSARWPEDGDVAGKRVAIVGNGASCMQIAPEIQDKVASLTIFQRSKHWVAPHASFRRVVPEPVRFLFREVPLYREWYRVRLGWTWNDRMHPTMQKDPDWPHPERSINATNERHRILFTEYIKEQLGDRVDDLLQKVLPSYPPFGKRMLLDNGWYRMLRDGKADLVTNPIERLEENRIITADGTEVEADVLVLATGFGGQKMLDTFEVVGRSGKTLRDEWEDDNPKAYLGTAVPGFPNFFVLYGPNLQPGHGGSLTFSLEMQVRYVMDVIRKMMSHELGAVEIREDTYAQYNEKVDAAHEKMLWSHPGMSTYYRNARGRVVINSPWRNVDFYEMTREAKLEEYRTERRTSHRGQGTSS